MGKDHLGYLGLLSRMILFRIQDGKTFLDALSWSSQSRHVGFCFKAENPNHYRLAPATF